jgi:hypothetical protein
MPSDLIRMRQQLHNWAMGDDFYLQYLPLLTWHAKIGKN